MNITDSFGQTPLHKAAIKDNWKVIEILINYGQKQESHGMKLKLDAKDIQGRNPLGLAIINGSSKSMFLLVQY